MGRDASPGTPCTFAPRRGVCPFRSECVRSRIQYIPYIYMCVCVYVCVYTLVRREFKSNLYCFRFRPVKPNTNVG